MAGERPVDGLSEAERAVVAEIEREVRRVLAEEPSPGFLVRVRARLPEPRASTGGWFAWWAAAAAVVALAAVAFVVVRSGTGRAGLTGGERTVAAPSNAAAPAGTIAGVGDRPARHPGAPAPTRERATPSARVRAAPSSTMTEPEVIVPAGQLDAARRWVAALRAAPIAARPLSIIGDEVPSALRFEDIAIEPLKTLPPDKLREPENRRTP